jgi:hypothetical protein
MPHIYPDEKHPVGVQEDVLLKGQLYQSVDEIYNTPGGRVKTYLCKTIRRHLFTDDLLTVY